MTRLNTCYPTDPLRTVDIHPLVQQIHPDLCNDSEDRIIDGVRFGKRWKHLVRSAQQALKANDRVSYDGLRWHFASAIELLAKNRRSDPSLACNPSRGPYPMVWIRTVPQQKWICETAPGALKPARVGSHTRKWRPYKELPHGYIPHRRNCVHDGGNASFWRRCLIAHNPDGIPNEYSQEAQQNPYRRPNSFARSLLSVRT